jgi:branched-chain amino acid transport system permease protein
MRSASVQFLLVALVTFALPAFLDSQYEDTVLVTIVMFASASLGARLIMASGVWSFGQGVFATVGAYTVALLTARAQWSFWIALVAGTALAGVAALVVGYPAIRVKGVYFAIFTMTAVFATRQLIVITPSFTGGAGGLTSVPSPSDIHIAGTTFSFGSPQSFYYLAALIFLGAFALMLRLDRSRVKPLLNACHQNPELASAVGIDVGRYRLLVFVIAGAVTGLMGGFSAGYYSLAHPEIWGFWPSTFIIAYAIVGGVGSVWGPVLGAGAVIIVNELLRATQGQQVIFLGIALIIVMILLPGGLIQLLSFNTIRRSQYLGLRVIRALTVRRASRTAISKADSLVDSSEASRNPRH